MKKKSLSFLLVFSILASLFTVMPITVNAETTEGIYTYSVENGEAIITYCDTSGKSAIEIPSMLGEYPVTKIGSNAFSVCHGLISVTIPDSVTTIGDQAFIACSDLTSVTIGDGVKTIGYSAFKNCDNITNITIPNGVETIGNHVFQGCTSLTRISLPNSITAIGDGAFSECESLISVIIPENVISVGDYTFSGCKSLTSVSIPYGVERIGKQAFYMCSSLTSIAIPGSVIIIGKNAFAACENLVSVRIADGVEHIGDLAFYECRKLDYVTLGNDVIYIGNEAFASRDQYGQYTDHISYVFYNGTEEEWNSVYVGSNNTSLLNGQVYFIEKSDATVLTVESKAVWIKEDDEIVIPINISNNTGITGLQVNCEYPSDMLVLSEVEKGNALGEMEFTVTTNLGKSPIVLLWDSMEEDNSNGEIALLKFALAEGITEGEYPITLDVEIACKQGLVNVPVIVEDGKIDVRGYLLGDANDDGEINIKDVIAIRHFIVDGDTEQIVRKGADTDKDGEITVKDVIVLRQFIAGGYGIELEY